MIFYHLSRARFFLMVRKYGWTTCVKRQFPKLCRHRSYMGNSSMNYTKTYILKYGFCKRHTEQKRNVVCNYKFVFKKYFRSKEKVCIVLCRGDTFFYISISRTVRLLMDRFLFVCDWVCLWNHPKNFKDSVKVLHILFLTPNPGPSLISVFFVKTHHGTQFL